MGDSIYLSAPQRISTLEIMTNQNSRNLFGTQTRSDSKGRSIENNLLLDTPEKEFAELRPHLEHTSLVLHQVWQDSGHTIDYGYFPNSGFASLLVVTSDAKSVEVSTVGKDGF